MLQAEGKRIAEQGDNQQALVFYENAYQLYQQIQSDYSQARLLYYRSWIYMVMNECSLVIQDIEAALLIDQRLNLPFFDVFQQHLDGLYEQQ